MDPNETLRLIRKLVRLTVDSDGTMERLPYPHELANAVNDLDEWLSKGGFLPDEWRWHEQQS